MKERKLGVHLDLKNGLGRLQTLVQQHPKMTNFAVVSCVAVIVAFSLAPSTTPARTESSTSTLDTFIPSGFVLVPIEVQNYESLDSVFGQRGVVNLYAATPGSSNAGRLIARHVRLLRSQENSTAFTVLVPEAWAPKLMRESGPFNVVVQNPNQHGTVFVQKPLGRRRTIIVESEE